MFQKIPFLWLNYNLNTTHFNLLHKENVLLKKPFGRTEEIEARNKSSETILLANYCTLDRLATILQFLPRNRNIFGC